LMFEVLGLIDIGWMIVPLQEQGYWCPPVFGHDEVDYAMALAVISYMKSPSGLRTAGVPMTW
jgi:hypothetical protein